jgi:hypothetical protein
MGVAVDEQRRFVIVRHFGGHCVEDVIEAARRQSLGRIDAREQSEITANQRRRPFGLEAGVGLRDEDEAGAVLRLGIGEGFLEPGDVRRHPFVGLGVHLRRPAAVIVAADDMHRHERHVVDRPREVLAELREFRITRLALNRHGPLSEAHTRRIEQLAHLGEPLQRIDLALEDEAGQPLSPGVRMNGCADC